MHFKISYLLEIRDLLTYETFLEPKTKIAEAIELFNKVPHNYLPIVSKHKLMGSIALADIEVLEKESILEDYEYLYRRVSVTADATWIDILQAITQNEIDIIPILDTTGNFVGYLGQSEFLQALQRTPFIGESGTSIIIETAIQNYSSSEISQIVESNNGKVLGLFISDMTDYLVECTVKISGHQINDIIQSFRRYGYNIKSELLEDEHLENLKERSKYLQKYLNI